MSSRKASIWACPRCGAKANKHGKPANACKDSRTLTGCTGFICECDSVFDAELTAAEMKAHGESAEAACPNAECYHCGWSGTFPARAFDPAKLKGWAKQAYEAGWRPPAGWSP